jgi:hypothetical protein
MILQPGTSSVAHLAAYPVLNSHLHKTLGASVGTSDGASMDTEGGEEARTELDSHANMCVIGRHAVILNRSGRHAEVNTFSPNIESLHKVSIVDAAIAYDCPYTCKCYILVVRNALHVESMDNNLIPPFVMREAGIEDCEVAKIHVSDPSVSDHSSYFKNHDLHIPLAL